MRYTLEARPSTCPAPRYALRAYNGLANRRLQPLGPLSVAADMPQGSALGKLTSPSSQALRGPTVLDCIGGKHAAHHDLHASLTPWRAEKAPRTKARARDSVPCQQGQ